jgi:predicted hydrocarbon binding protein
MYTELRSELGDFSSIVCLKAIITGMEEALGDKATAIALVAAGRTRGKNLAKASGLDNSAIPLEDLASKVAFALGKDGTRLLLLDKIEPNGEGYQAYVRETVCMAGEPAGSPRRCTFTLGAIQGVLEAYSGKRLRGQHTASSTQGNVQDVFSYQVIG